MTNPTDRAKTLVTELSDIDDAATEAQLEVLATEAAAASARAVAGRLRQRRYFVKARLEKEAQHLRRALTEPIWSEEQKEQIRRVLAFLESE